MGFFHHYPYTDMHDMNLDWILSEIKRLDQDLTGIEERATAAAIAGAKEYVDIELQSVLNQFTSLKNDFDVLTQRFNTTVQDLDSQYTAFIALVNANLAIMDGKINAIQADIDNKIAIVNARTDIAIQHNNEYIFQQIEERISDNIKVTNFFTGNRVTIQEMFNYLAQLHVTDGITYTELATRNKTYAELAALDITYTDLAVHGGSLIV